jgi:hypothetical protein
MHALPRKPSSLLEGRRRERVTPEKSHPVGRKEGRKRKEKKERNKERKKERRKDRQTQTENA